VGRFEFVLEPIPKGFKLIAVGEHYATPTESPTKRHLTLKGSNCSGYVTPSGSESLYSSSPWASRNASTPAGLPRWGPRLAHGY
jgi:hypothetical protein